MFFNVVNSKKRIMKKFFYLISILAFSSFFSCQNEMTVLDDSLGNAVMEISASIENEMGSRTQLDGAQNNGVVWSSNDKLSVFLGNTMNQEFTLESGAGEGNATFKGSGDMYINAGTETNVETQANVAYYPFASDVSLSYNVTTGYQITANFPEVQYYKENSFGQFAAPMVAVTKDNYDNAFKFKNVASLFKVQMKKGNENKKISKVILSSEEHKMAGKYTVTASYAGEPSFEFGSEALQTITLDCGEDGVALTDEGVLFIFVIPYQNYASGKLTFTFYTTDEEYMSFSSEKGYDVGRSESYIIKDKTYSKTGEVQHLVKDANGNATIYTAKGLQQLVAEVNGANIARGLQGEENAPNNYAGKTITLANDLDLSDIADWTPIGNGSRSGNAADGNSFKGTFDGQGHIITGLNITSGSDDNAVGLFGVVDGGTVKNVELKDVTINASSSELTGAAVGFLTGGGVVDEVTVSGEITANKGVGGVVGRATVSATISNCENSATINATSGNAGGIIGAAYYTSSGNVYTGENAALVIGNCTNSGDVTTSAGGYTGGIVGLSSVSVTNCTNTGDVKGANTSVGGIVGEQKESGEVIGCANNGTVTNTANAYGTGGIVGWVRYPASEAGSGKAYEVQNIIIVKGNTNTASIVGGSDAGGIVGTVYNYAVVTENNNSAASLSSSSFAAGIVGNVQFDNTNANDLVNGTSWMVEVTENTSTTALENMTVNGTCRAAYAYDNSVGANTQINGNRGCPDVQTEQVAEGVVKLDATTYELSKAKGWSYFQGKQQTDITIHIVDDLEFTDEDSEISAISAWYSSVKIIGHGKTISGAKVKSGNDDNGTEQASLFFCSVNSTLEISDLTLKDIVVTTENVDNGYAAAVVGYCQGNTTLTNVDVVNAQITGSKSSGMLVGHLESNGKLSATGCDVSGTITLLDYEANGHYAGDYIGTVAQVAELANCTANVNLTGNLNSANVGKIYGRITGAGALTVDGKAYVTNSSGLSSALASNGNVILTSGEYDLPSVSDSEVSISGTEETVITINTPNYTGSDVTLTGVTVKGSGYSTGIQHVETVTYNDVTIKGEMCLYGKKVVFNGCDFELAANQYIWTYGAGEVEFINCTFNTAGKAILIYNEGAGPSKVTVTGCNFYATAGAKAGAIANQNCAAIEIDNYQKTEKGASHTLITSGNTYDNNNFSGEWRIKNYQSGGVITVNDVEYTSLAIDGKTMTIDGNKNVTVND